MAILKPTRGDDVKLAGGLIRIKNDLTHEGQVAARHVGSDDGPGGGC
ncbi:hypothetical protein PAJL_1531 [Cutibacterium acnes HL042PA3]|nr:hypothetical protein PAJL_1531 [Cutibacterium acnes HL042PA3]MCW5114630.1 hypothetical protein [Cutibacterium acnes P05]